MQGETWRDYGTPGTQALGHEEIEQAIARLTRVWDDAQTHTQDVKLMSRASRLRLLLPAGLLIDSLWGYADPK